MSKAFKFSALFYCCFFCDGPNLLSDLKLGCLLSIMKSEFLSKRSHIQSEINNSDLLNTAHVFPAYTHMLHGGGEEHVKLHTNAKHATTFPCHFSAMHDKRAASS